MQGERYMIVCDMVRFNGLPVMRLPVAEGRRTAVIKSSWSPTQLAGRFGSAAAKVDKSWTAVAPTTMNMTKNRFWCEPNLIKAHF